MEDCKAETSEEHITPAQQMFAAASGALITSLLMTPFDVVKIRIQSQQSNSGGSRGNMVCPVASIDNMKFQTKEGYFPFSSFPKLKQSPTSVMPCTYIMNNGLMDHVCVICQQSRQLVFTGTVDAFRKIATNEGVTSLWRGLSPTLLMALPATVVYFTMYDQLKSNLFSSVSTSYAPLMSGITSRVISSTLVSPFELIRTKAQSMVEVNGSSALYKKLGNDVVKMIRTQGIYVLWKGLWPTLWRDVPFSAIYWQLYETGKLRCIQEGSNKNDKSGADWRERFISSFGIGAASGMVAATITLPFDVAKTRQQIAWTNSEFVGGNKIQCNISMLNIMKDILKNEGIRGLFAGLTPRILKVAPACAIMISSYEACKLIFRNRNKKTIM